MKIGDLIKYAARAEPEKIGLITDSGRYTFQQLYEFCNSLANGLVQMNFKVGDRVALLLRNGLEIIVSFFGVPRMGAIVVPLNYKMAKNELVYCLNDSTPKMLIYGEEYEDMIEYLQGECKSIEYFVSPAEFQKIITSYSKEGPTDLNGKRIKLSNKNTLFLMYTGGTTGFPKGVMLSHKNITSTMAASAGKMLSDVKNYSEEKRLRQVERMEKREGIFMTDLPIFHAAAMFTVIVAMYGATPMVTHKRFDPIYTYETIEKEKVTNLELVPTMLIRLLEAYDPKYDISSLQTIFYGAAAIDPTTLKKALEVFKNVEFLQVFGMTETAVPVTTLTSEDHELIRDEERDELLRSAGKAIAGVEIKIVDEMRNELPIGEIGEIVVRGEGIMQGYWNKEEKTKSVIDEDGWYYTGDMGKLDEKGYLYVMDRAKDMIVSGGENIYSAEVENAIYKHQAVKLCAVIGIPDDKWGEAVCAYIVKKEGYELTGEEIIQHCKEYIASYKKPKRIIFIRKLPMSPQGKILKKILREKHWKDKERKVI
ncbi:MAG: class I adenylate-forming enzyme family protein [Candidatus Hodarchaeota archaeon]